MGGKDKAVELAQDYLEIGFDAAVEVNKQFLPALVSAAEEVPFVKTLILALQMPSTISDQILGAKILKFLYASELDEEKVEKLRTSIKNEKFEKILRRVVLSLEAHDDEEKCKIVGKLFKALLEEKITTKEFTSMIHATNSLNLDFIESLKTHYMLNNAEIGGHRTLFVTLGLLNINESGIGTFGGGGPTYPMTSLGWKYLGIVLDHPETSIKDIHMGVSELHYEITEGGLRGSSAYPMEIFIKEDKRYERVDLFAIDENYNVGCKNGIPTKLSTHFPTIAESYEDGVKAMMIQKNIPLDSRFASIQAKFEENIMVRTYAVISDLTKLGLEPVEYIDARNNLFADLGSVNDPLIDLIDNLLQYKSEIPNFFEKFSVQLKKTDQF